MTESGKTTLAKELARRARLNGRAVIVLDPMHDNWNADFQTDDVSTFLRVFWESQSCDVFIDESGDAIGRYNDAMIRTATKGRHWGHKVHYITQRGAQLSMTVRAQCSRIFLFSIWPDDAKAMAASFNQPALLEAANLGKGDYIYYRRFGAIQRGNIFQQINGA